MHAAIRAPGCSPAGEAGGQRGEPPDGALGTRLRGPGAILGMMALTDPSTAQARARAADAFSQTDAKARAKFRVAAAAGGARLSAIAYPLTGKAIRHLAS